MHTPPDAAATLYFPDELPAALTAEPSLTVSDITAGAARALDELLPPAEPALRDETPRYAHFPWRNALVKIPGPRTFRRLRLDRNRHKLTASQQAAAGELRIGVVGLSVGHAISLTLALEGLAGELRLADFDDLELTNMNRIPATLMDIHDNKGRDRRSTHFRDRPLSHHRRTCGRHNNREHR